MKRAYVFGPIAADTEWGIYLNIEQARTIASELWRIGYTTFCPHTNTEHMHGITTHDKFIEGDLEWMKFADILVGTPDWEKSKGARIEKAKADELNIPIYIWPDVPKPEDLP